MKGFSHGRSGCAYLFCDLCFYESFVRPDLAAEDLLPQRGVNLSADGRTISDDELFQSLPQAVLLMRSLVKPHTSPSPSSPPLKGGEILQPSPLEGEGEGEGALLMNSLVEWLTRETKETRKTK
jgi:hypothetical protein